MGRRILVTGGGGQLGAELALAAGADALLLPARDRLDIAEPASVAAFFAAERVDGVVNAAAYTAVDRAESDVASAWAVNAFGAAHVATAAARAGVPIVHVSTDYVFDGDADRPYRETDPVGPRSVYGASKLAGEIAVLAANPRAAVVRTAWVVSVRRANFVKTMLRVGAAASEVRVVADQRGCPTAARDLAGALLAIVTRMIAADDAPAGLFHFVNGGEASWHELAEEVFAVAGKRGGPRPAVRAIATADYPTPARRPFNSRLDTGRIERDYGIVLRPWQAAIREIVEELVPAGDRKGDQ